MFRSIPSSNKKLSKLWNEKNLSLHQSNLRKIKSRIDLSSPSQFTHLTFKAKTLTMQEERFSEIERENRMLLKKMKKISSIHSARTLPGISKSLNRASRKRKDIQILAENQAIMKRILQKKSAYDTDKWETQRKAVERMLENICEYPYTLGSSQRLFRSTFKSSKSTSKFAETPKTANDKRKIADSSVLLKKKINLAGITFLVEVRKNFKESVCAGYKISAFKKDSTVPYVFQIGTEEALEIMGGKEDCNKLVSALKMDGDDMILVEYREVN